MQCAREAEYDAPVGTTDQPERNEEEQPERSGEEQPERSEEEQPERSEDETPAQSEGDLDLSFEQADMESAVVPCARCAQPLSGEYYEADGTSVCAACARIIRYGEPGDSPFVRAARALGLGILAATASGFLWWAIRAATGYEIGLIAVVVGLAVGFAVRFGARARGGWFYQTMGIVLTYLAIVSTYVPEAMDAIRAPPPEDRPSPEEVTVEAAPPPAPPADDIPTPIVFVIACVIALFAPFLAGLENIIGMAIIAFALWEAWRVNKRPIKKLLGPYALGAPR